MRITKRRRPRKGRFFVGRRDDREGRASAPGECMRVFVVAGSPSARRPWACRPAAGRLRHCRRSRRASRARVGAGAVDLLVGRPRFAAGGEAQQLEAAGTPVRARASRQGRDRHGAGAGSRPGAGARARSSCVRQPAVARTTCSPTCSCSPGPSSRQSTSCLVDGGETFRLLRAEDGEARADGRRRGPATCSRCCRSAGMQSASAPRACSTRSTRRPSTWASARGMSNVLTGPAAR